MGPVRLENQDQNDEGTNDDPDGDTLEEALEAARQKTY